MRLLAGLGLQDKDKVQVVETRKEAERLRRELFDDALAKFRKGKVEEVGTIQQR